MKSAFMRAACFIPAFLFVASIASAQPVDSNGVRVSFDRYSGPATISSSSLEKFKLRLDVDRKGDSQPLALRVNLPASGSQTWPINDVEVRDAAGKAMLVQRSGIEWEQLLIPLPADVTTCFIQAVEPPQGWPKTTSEKERTIKDEASGAVVCIANWPQGRKAALSIRFDDSHPTHLSKAMPILGEYGFKGTFLVNPGPKEPGSRQSYEFELQHDAWAAAIQQGHHELGNHSAHHRGAKGDDDMEHEIGSAAEAIWKLMPGKSKLVALNLGGGTRWETTRTLRYYLAKYQQFDASSGSLGMDDSYGGRVEAFRKALSLHLERGLWCRIHYHYIGEGLSSSEANFRAALDIVKQQEGQLWIAGMADIYKYQTERNAAKLTLVKSDAKSLAFKLDCATDSALYDQPLTMELIPPTTWNRAGIKVLKDQNAAMSAKPVKIGEQERLHFEVPAKGAQFSIQSMP